MLRKIISLTLFFSFIVLIFTSLALFAAPHGRVAFWTNWTHWHLTKTDWTNIHITIGFFFIALSIIHMFFNLKPLKTYIISHKKYFINPAEPLIALILVLIICVGTYYNTFPFNKIINFGEHLKEKVALKYGEPPYGHAERSSLKIFCKRLSINLNDAIKNLKSANYKFSNINQTLEQMAKLNSVTPQQIYRVITKNKIVKQGFGKITLKQLCQKEGYDITKVISVLKNKNITANENTKIKIIASQLDIHPAKFNNFLQTQLK